MVNWFDDHFFMLEQAYMEIKSAVVENGWSFQGLFGIRHTSIWKGKDVCRGSRKVAQNPFSQTLKISLIFNYYNLFYGQFIMTISSSFHLSNLGPEIHHPDEIMGPEF
jgi:hypothetical protein